MSKHIDFDTGNMLFEIADEYERLASNPPTLDPDSPRRKQVAAETALGALRMSQIKTAKDLGQNQVPFRHLSMLAQIRSVTMKYGPPYQDPDISRANLMGHLEHGLRK